MLIWYFLKLFSRKLYFCFIRAEGVHRIHKASAYMLSFSFQSSSLYFEEFLSRVTILLSHYRKCFTQAKPLIVERMKRERIHSIPFSIKYGKFFYRINIIILQETFYRDISLEMFFQRVSNNEFLKDILNLYCLISINVGFIGKILCILQENLYFLYDFFFNLLFLF